MTNQKYGGLEVYFTFVPSDGRTVELDVDIIGTPSFAIVDPGVIAVVIGKEVDETLSGVYFQVGLYVGGDLVEQSDHQMDSDVLSLPAATVRVFFFNNSVSVYINDKWIFVHTFVDIVYPEEPTATLFAIGDDFTITSIRRAELYDGREAVWVDYEATADNVIGSIIQQRPVEIFPHVDRKHIFTYDAEKDTYVPNKVRKYDIGFDPSSQLASDALMYFEDVGINIHQLTAKTFGLITKMLRLSDLSTGATRAARAMQKKAYERSFPATIEMRLDPRIEASDVLDLSTISATGTSRTFDDQIVVESAQVKLTDGSFGMTVTGRKKIDAS